MEFINHTSYQAGLFFMALDHERTLVVVVAKATYQFARDGTVMLDQRSPIPIYQGFHPSDLGQLWPDVFARKRGADVLVFGRAVSRGRKPTRTLEVGLRVGEVTQTLRVFGRRAWRKRILRTGIEGPEWFDEMPLTWERAYGGRAIGLHQPVPFANNPQGKGYVLDRDQIGGIELPNLEDPALLIRSWRDQPRPLAFAPIPPDSALIDTDDPDSNPSREATVSGPFASPSSTLNIAHPGLRTTKLRNGDVVGLSHMCEEGWQQFRLRLPSLFLDVTLGGKQQVLPCDTDTLVLYPDDWRYALVARRAFHCPMQDEPSSVVRLLEGARPDDDWRE